MPSNEDLPGEIIQQIQLRLPVKSLMRFCCVSRNWLSTISSPKFRKAHFKLASQQQTLSPPRFLRFISDSQFESIDIETPSLGDRHSVRNLTSPIWKAWNNWCSSVVVMGSCKGLVCLLFSDISLWNPTTGSVQSLSCPFLKGTGREDFVAFDGGGIGHVSATDDYKIVLRCTYIQQIYTPEPDHSVIEIFSLRAMSWKRKEAPKTFPKEHDDIGVYSNEVIHWIELFLEPTREAILAFDLVKEEFRDIPLPIEKEDKRGEMTLGVVLGGCLCLTTFCDHEFIQCWVMREYNVHQSWTKIFKFYVGIHPGFRKPIFCSESCIIVQQMEEDGRYYYTKFDHHEEKPDDEVAVCTGQYMLRSEFEIIQYDESLLPIDDYIRP